MKEPVIKFENVSKMYKLGTLSLRETIKNSALKIIRRDSQDVREFWALRNVSFEVNQGEVVGIVGPNGAGKSTILKLLSRISEPTSGKVEVKGKVASLIEVGAGFHPELTGRENIYLNGSILGLSKKEIDRKLDSIVAFSELEKFIDTPVKRYSSGMYVRLGFSIAIHTEPEILLVDEVLSVGDAAFRKKSFDAAEAMIKSGVTVLIVSHNMSAINRVCQRGIWLENGQVVGEGEPQDVVDDYVAATHVPDDRRSLELPADSTKPMCLREACLVDQNGDMLDTARVDEPFKVRLAYDVNRVVQGAHVICIFETSDDIQVFATADADCAPELRLARQPGHYRGEVEIPAHLLGEGRYLMTISLGVPYKTIYDRHEHALSFELVDETPFRVKWLGHRRPGLIGTMLSWSYADEFEATSMVNKR